MGPFALPRPVVTTYHALKGFAVVDLERQNLLAMTVREWVGSMLPDDRLAADTAAAVAVSATESGDSSTEANRKARTFARCWARHPAHKVLPSLSIEPSQA